MHRSCATMWLLPGTRYTPSSRGPHSSRYSRRRNAAPGSQCRASAPVTGSSSLYSASAWSTPPPPRAEKNDADGPDARGGARVRSTSGTSGAPNATPRALGTRTPRIVVGRRSAPAAPPGAPGPAPGSSPANEGPEPGPASGGLASAYGASPAPETDAAPARCVWRPLQPSWSLPLPRPPQSRAKPTPAPRRSLSLAC